MPSSPQQVPLEGPQEVPPKERSLASIKTAGFPKEETDAWEKGYDRARGPHPDKYAAAWRALDAARRSRNREDRDGQSGAIPQIPPAVRGANE